LVDEGKLIQVSRAQLVSAAGNSITLSTGEKAPSDGIVFCTGLEMAIPPLFSPPLARELGLAVDRADLSEEETRHWQSLDKAAEDEFLELYPIFKDPPNNIHIPNFALTPFRLFRTLVPPKPDQTAQTNILFLGNYATGQVQANAEITSLWGVAYLEGLLPSSTTSILQDKAQMDKDIAWNEAYKRKRYSNYI
jgi:dimethylaniline monooxygenase (N-oxide forming)